MSQLVVGHGFTLWSIGCMVKKMKRYIRHMSVYTNRQKIHLMIILGLIAYGAWLRLIDISASLWFLPGHDEPRDMLVAKHIVEYGEWIWRGPFAAGSGNQLMNSPVYYWILALFWFVGRSVLGVSVIWALVSCVSMWLAYKIGELLWDKTTGLILLAIVAVHPEFVYNSLHISQPYVLPLSTFAFLALMLSRRAFTNTTLALATCVAFFPIHLHYGSLVVLPVSFMWIMQKSISRYRLHRDISAILVPMVSAEVMVCIWIFLSYSRSAFDQVGYFIRSVATITDEGTVFREVVARALHNAWWSPDYRSALIVVLCAIGLSVWRAKKDRTHGFDARYVWLIAYAIVPLVLASAQKSQVHATYLLGTLPAILLLVAVGIRVLWQAHRMIGVILLCTLLLLFSQQNAAEKTVLLDGGHIYHQFQRIARSVLSDYSTINNEGSVHMAAAVVVGEYPPYDGWSAAFWFAMEEQVGYPLTELINTGASFSPRNEDKAKVMYLVCDHRGGLDAGGCVDMFRSVRAYVLPGEKEIYAQGVFSVYRFQLSPRQPVQSHNEVYFQ